MLHAVCQTIFDLHKKYTDNCIKQIAATLSGLVKQQDSDIITAAVAAAATTSVFV